MAKKAKKKSSAKKASAKKRKANTPSAANRKKSSSKSKAGGTKKKLANTSRSKKLKKKKPAATRSPAKTKTRQAPKSPSATKKMPAPQAPPSSDPSDTLPPEDVVKLPTDAQLRRVKTDITRKDLNQYRKLLLEKRAEILGDVVTMEADARNTNAGGNLSTMPMHMADIGSDNYEQEFTLVLVESERKLLGEIESALVRIQHGIYGVCVETAVPIGRARLDAKPWAKYCIEVAREKERMGLL